MEITGDSASRSSRSRPTSAGIDQSCAVCWNLLCEPVAWPDCSHHLCLVCALRTRRRPKPSCPLCRAPAKQVRKAAELQVSATHASLIRRAAGYQSYESQRRETWAQAAELDAAGGLGGPLPLVAGAGAAWHQLRSGVRQEVKMLLEPRYEELLRRSRTSKDGCRFAVVLEPAGFEVGAKGRVCKILDSNPDPTSSAWLVTVEGGAACRIIELDSEEVQRGEEPLFIGKLEELDEEDLQLVSAGVDQLGGTITAASEMVGILSVLGRNLQVIRHRWMMAALVGMLGQEEHEDASLGSMVQTDREGLESMLGLMVSYRQIIHQMDRLLSQASATADHLDHLMPDEGDDADVVEEAGEDDDEDSLWRRLQERSAQRSARALRPESYALRVEESYRRQPLISLAAPASAQSRSSREAQTMEPRPGRGDQAGNSAPQPHEEGPSPRTERAERAPRRAGSRVGRNTLPGVPMTQAEALRRRGRGSSSAAASTSTSNVSPNSPSASAPSPSASSATGRGFFRSSRLPMPSTPVRVRSGIVPAATRARQASTSATRGSR